MKNCVNHNIRILSTLTLLIPILLMGTHSISPMGTDSLSPLRSAMAQPQPLTLLVNFDSITVHRSHDLGWGNDGEWELGAFVNDADVWLSTPESGLGDVADDDTKSLRGVSAQVAPAQDNDLRIQTRGFEQDNEGSVLPNIPYGLDKIPYSNYYNIVKDVVNFIGGCCNPDDGIGVVHERYVGPPWGAGYHEVRSDCNGVDGDSCGDFTLRFTVIPIVLPPPPTGGVGANETSAALTDLLKSLGTSKTVPTSHISLANLNLFKTLLNQSKDVLEKGDINGTIAKINQLKQMLFTYINGLKVFNMTETTNAVGAPFTVNLTGIRTALSEANIALNKTDTNLALQKIDQAIRGLGTTDTGGLGAPQVKIRGAISPAQ